MIGCWDTDNFCYPETGQQHRHDWHTAQVSRADGGWLILWYCTRCRKTEKGEHNDD